MLPRVTRSPKAIRDIKTEWLYLFEDNGVKVADRFLESVEQTIELLSQAPLIGKLRYSTKRAPKEYRRFPVRHPFEDWAILYLPSPKGIIILRVVHGMRHPEALLP